MKKYFTKFNKNLNIAKNFIFIFIYNIIILISINNLIYIPIIKSIILLVSLLSVVLGAAYISLNERHLVAIIQRRVGPSITGGSYGLLQPLIDGLKLLLKDIMYPSKSQKFWFLFAPLFTFYITLITWMWVDFDIYQTIFFKNSYNIIGIVSFLVISSHGILIGSWYSNNKFAGLGAIRSISLSISYGLSITLIFLSPVYLSSNYSLKEIILNQQSFWYLLVCFPISILFWITLLTEIKKIPFDVSESEAELASGYMIEYSGSNFALLVISEYIYIIVLLTLYVNLFTAGLINGVFFYYIKLIIVIIVYFTIRSILPNFRYDQIMTLHWKYILPSSLLYLLILIYLTIN